MNATQHVSLARVVLLHPAHSDASRELRLLQKGVDQQFRARRGAAVGGAGDAARRWNRAVSCSGMAIASKESHSRGVPATATRLGAMVSTICSASAAAFAACLLRSAFSTLMSGNTRVATSAARPTALSSSVAVPKMACMNGR